MKYSLKEKDDTDQLAGLCVKALDTGKVLMLKRRSESELHVDNKGQWEFPGGHVKKGEHPFQAALREWHEEVGRKLPHGEVHDSFHKNEYTGYIYLIPKQNLIDTSFDGRGFDPDDPDGQHPQMLKWWKVKKLKKAINNSDKKTSPHLEGLNTDKLKEAGAEKAWYNK